MFRETEYKNGTLHYLPGAPIRRILWGYLKVGKVLNDQAGIIAVASMHPHAKKMHPHNCLYLRRGKGTLF